MSSSKMLSQLKLETTSPKKVDNYLRKIAKILFTHIISNVLIRKEAGYLLHNKTNTSNIHKITLSDIKETIDTIKRFTNFSNTKIMMKGGNFYLPSTFFSGLESVAHHSDGTQTSIGPNENFARQALPSTQFASQLGGSNSSLKKGSKSLQKIMSSIISKEDVLDMIDDYNKNHSKNKISIDSENSIKLIQDAINKNIFSLLIQYSIKVDKTNLNVDKLKELIENDKSLKHMQKVM